LACNRIYLHRYRVVASRDLPVSWMPSRYLVVTFSERGSRIDGYFRLQWAGADALWDRDGPLLCFWFASAPSCTLLA
jgi:hypothetical protein